MIKQQFTPKRTVCKVTFSIPEEWANSSAEIVGDFNEWQTGADSLTKNKNRWETTLRLKPGTEYRFRYLLDGERWENDDAADAYIPNEYGSDDSVVRTGT
ncbi:isoamylase early set domain-containing protein [Rhodohalobacter mucosus]|uniref:Glycoside hydrolase n=1 Tax=Rhodohalobacter mucosus TaxID=2079485 RepID=A0A316U2E3_9BACT|nr:isoamylase early set domain-containing protein [Rhodohalobacter mucosus]PWN07366.1 glycoside hydrolase [Rhodohalobacter mucosus]